MSRLTAAIVLLVLASALWWLQDVSDTYRLFGAPVLSRAFDLAAAIATAFLVVLVLGEAILQVGRALVSSFETTAFQRAILYVALGLVAGAAVLAHLGINVAAVLATSALLTAIVGFALQPTLGSLIAGLSLHGGAIRIGDGVVHGGEPVVIHSLNWRSVVGRKADGTIVVIPNTHLVASPATIMPRDRPVQIDTLFPAPLTVAPDLLGEILAETVAGIAQLDPARPVTVVPVGLRPSAATVHYRVRSWLLDYRDRSDVEPEILRRVWYAMQREGLEWPMSTLYERHLLPDVATLLGTDCATALARALASDSDPGTDAYDLVALCYAPEESIVVPARIAPDARCVLVRGRVAESGTGAAGAWTGIATGIEDRHVAAHPGMGHGMAPRDGVGRVAQRLRDFIGPYADRATLRVAGSTSDPGEIWGLVAGEIDDPAERRAFLAERPETLPCRGPGFGFGLVPRPNGSSVASPRLRAVEACVIVAMTARADPANAVTGSAGTPTPT